MTPRVLHPFALALLALGACAPATPTCIDDKDCSDGFVCVLDKENDTRVCADPCAADAACESGYACVPIAESSEGVCLALTDDLPDGSRCVSDQDCASGACAGSGADTICAPVCAEIDECEDGTRCTLDGLRYVCVEPTADKENGEECADARECRSGTCVGLPSSGDLICAANCTDDGNECGDDEVCARLELGAHACIPALPDGAECAVDTECSGGFCVADIDGTKKCARACDASGACPDDLFCVPDDADNDVCMPRLDSRPAGDACESDRQCASSLCRRFATETEELGTLCADPCAAAEPFCPVDEVCWEGDDVDVCGPTPP
jgi:hypothetical protein